MIQTSVLVLIMQLRIYPEKLEMLNPGRASKRHDYQVKWTRKFLYDLQSVCRAGIFKMVIDNDMIEMMAEGEFRMKLYSIRASRVSMVSVPLVSRLRWSSSIDGGQQKSKVIGRHIVVEHGWLLLHRYPAQALCRWSQIRFQFALQGAIIFSFINHFPFYKFMVM